MNEKNIESVIEKLKALRMKTAAEHLVRILQRADTQNLPPLMIIEALVDIEEEMRQKNRVLRRFEPDMNLGFFRAIPVVGPVHGKNSINQGAVDKGQITQLGIPLW